MIVGRLARGKDVFAPVFDKNRGFLTFQPFVCSVG